MSTRKAHVIVASDAMTEHGGDRLRAMVCQGCRRITPAQSSYLRSVSFRVVAWCRDCGDSKFRKVA